MERQDLITHNGSTGKGPRSPEVPAHTLAVLAPGKATIVAPQGARYVVIGGAPLDGPRFIWWNFVSSSKARIEQAKDDWTAQRIGTIPGEHEWIPLP